MIRFGGRRSWRDRIYLVGASARTLSPLQFVFEIKPVSGARRGIYTKNGSEMNGAKEWATVPGVGQSPLGRGARRTPGRAGLVDWRVSQIHGAVWRGDRGSDASIPIAASRVGGDPF